MTSGISRIELQGFKSLREVDLELESLNVLVGANGAGKSNFLSAFRLLNSLTEGRLADFVGRAGGANGLLFRGAKVSPRLALALRFRTDSGTNTYRAELTRVAPDDLMFTHEQVEFAPDQGAGRRYDFGGGHRESRLGSTIDAGGPSGEVARFIKSHLDRWRSFHFHDTSDAAPVKQTAALNDNRFLRGDASNLAPFLSMLRATAPGHFAQLRETVRLAFPLFDDFVLEPSRLNPNSMLLGWRERGHDLEFGAHQLSDGTLRFICLAALLLQPRDTQTAPRTITLDEPELGLHPAALTLLAGMLKEASSQMQIVVSTQSAALLSALEASTAVIVVDRVDGASRLRRVQPAELEPWLESYSLGDVWEKGIFGGRP